MVFFGRTKPFKVRDGKSYCAMRRPEAFEGREKFVEKRKDPKSWEPAHGENYRENLRVKLIEYAEGAKETTE